MQRLAARIAVASLLLASAAHADYEFATLFTSTEWIGHTGLAVAPDGDLVAAWAENGVGVWTYEDFGGATPPPEFHGPGSWASVCWSAHGFTLAWADANTIHLRLHDGSGWSDIGTLQSSDGLDIMGLTLTGAVPYVGFDGIYLAWREQGDRLWFSSYVGGIWTEPEPVASISQGLGVASPEALPVDGVNGLQPRYYYLGDYDEGLWYREYNGTAWSDPVTVDDPWVFGTNVDVAVGPGGLHHALGNGPQPTCPCNIMQYCRELPSGEWSDTEILANDWPQFPSIDVSPDGTVHAFYYESYWWELQYIGEALRYMIHDGSQWQDLSNEIGYPSAGAWVKTAVDPVGEMLFLWAQGEEDAPHVTLGWDRPASGADPPQSFVSDLELTAGPNPVGPATQLAYTLPHAGPVRLEIVDLQGRRVALPFAGHREAGRHTLAWRGVDDRGRALAPGVYFAHLRSEGAGALVKLILTDG
ncbi:MAG: hypothetical protein GF355_04300 [Candidatus Eisenbacteria bacterium]|nr:hypothetical protein [Candidatus Eisenbacteria bacterium]